MKAIRVHDIGGPEKLSLEDIPTPEPGPGQARVRIHAAGVNFIDIYFRTGQYKTPLPFVPGMEASGVVEAVAENVSSVRPGDRVAYAMSLGAYAEQSVVDAWKLVRIPEAMSFETAAACLLQGMTAHYLIFSTFPLKSGETALIHAAAGGVGLLLVQMAKKAGATVIGTVSTDAKADQARSAGADDVILYETADFADEVMKLTDGAGVHVVYDSVGRSTFEKGLRCLRPRGMMVLFGQASGAVAPLDPQILNASGSVYLTRPSLGHYSATREEVEWRAGDVLRWIADGTLKLHIARNLSLARAAEAHRVLEGRQTTGKVVLTP